jgi:hypothetical protein
MIYSPVGLFSRLVHGRDRDLAGREFRKGVAQRVAKCEVLLAVMGPSWLVRRSGGFWYDPSNHHLRAARGGLKASPATLEGSGA